jgi:hypothetical protein
MWNLRYPSTSRSEVSEVGAGKYEVDIFHDADTCRVLETGACWH